MGGILIGLGGLIAVIGWIWLIVVAFKTGGALWGILVFLFNWLAGLIFAIVNKTGWTQLGMMVLGWILVIIGAMMSGGGSYTYP